MKLFLGDLQAEIDQQFPAIEEDEDFEACMPGPAMRAENANHLHCPVEDRHGHITYTCFYLFAIRPVETSRRALNVLHQIGRSGMQDRKMQYLIPFF